MATQNLNAKRIGEEEKKWKQTTQQTKNRMTE